MEPYKLDYHTGGTIVLSFFIQDDHLEPAVLTNTLGIQPSLSWKKGDPHAKVKGVHYPSGSWQLIAHCWATDSFEHQLDTLLTQLERLPAVLYDYTQMYDAGLSVGLTSVDSNIGLSLTVEAIQRMSRLNLSLDFDLYYIAPPRSEDDAISQD